MDKLCHLSGLSTHYYLKKNLIEQSEIHILVLGSMWPLGLCQQFVSKCTHLRGHSSILGK